MFENWWDRATFPNAHDWIDADMTVLAVAPLAYAVARYARSTWLQWLAGIVTTADCVYWLVKFAI
jgi:hypothetical protein